MTDSLKEAKQFFDLPELFYFQSGNRYTGSKNGMRFCLTPEEKILAEVWYQDLCREQVEPEQEQEFPLSQEGYEAMLAWLRQCWGQKHE